MPSKSVCHSPWILLAFSLPAFGVTTVGFDSDDFIIATFNSDTIEVYDHDLTYKGPLDANFPNATGLDFDREGNLVAVGQSRQVRVYNAGGDLVSGFTHDDIFNAIDLKVGPNGNYYVGTRERGLREFTPDGESIAQFGTRRYSGVAVLPGSELWGGVAGTRNSFGVFDIPTKTLKRFIEYDNGQARAASMFYSATTDTVLMVSDFYANGVYERDRDGQFVREFTAPGFSSSTGVTRGPGGDVFATDESDELVYRWKSDGTFVGAIDLTLTNSGIVSPVNIVWAGNFVPVPEPSTLALSLVALCSVMSRRRAFQLPSI